LADAQDSGSCPGNWVEVQVLSRAFSSAGFYLGSSESFVGIREQLPWESRPGPPAGGELASPRMDGTLAFP
jgi:hypothetical protein